MIELQNDLKSANLIKLNNTMVATNYRCDVVADNVVRVSRLHNKEKVDISFKRTVKVPDNIDVFNFPPDHGNMPLYSVKDFKHSLPPNMVAKRGLFMPMYRTH